MLECDQYWVADGALKKRVLLPPGVKGARAASPLTGASAAAVEEADSVARFIGRTASTSTPSAVGLAFGPSWVGSASSCAWHLSKCAASRLLVVSDSLYFLRTI